MPLVYIGSRFTVDVKNGTERQFNLLMEALDDCTFPWDRVAAQVEVYFTADPTPSVDFEAAWCETTLYQMPVPMPGAANELADILPHYDANYPSDALPLSTIRIAQALDNPQDQMYVSDEFFKECVIHEFGHVVSAMMTPEQQARIAGTLGMTMADWSPPATTRESWMDRGMEVFAETFKDLYLQRDDREYDNRTNHRVVKERLTDFYDVLEEIVAWSPGRTIFGGSGVYGMNLLLDEVEYVEFGWATSPFTSPLYSEIVGHQVWVIFAVMDEKKPGGVNWGGHAEMRFIATDTNSGVLVDTEFSGDPGHNVFGPFPLPDTPSDELLFEGSIGTVAGSDHSGALVPSELTTFSTFEGEPIWLIGYYTRFRQSVPEMPRPAYPYEDVGIRASGGPAGTIRRSRP